MPVLGGTPKQLIRDVDSAPAFSPDGQRFAYVRGVLLAKTLEMTSCWPTPTARANACSQSAGVLDRGDSNVSWSADGRNLALVSPETRNGNSQWVLETVSVDSGEVRDLHAFPIFAQAAAWLPDDSGLLVAGTEPETARGQIWFVSYPKGEVSRLTNDLADYDGCCLQVTRDGRSLVALQDTNLSDVWVVKGDGSDARQITTGEALGFGLSWVGNRLAAANSRGQWFLMNPDGSARSPLTNDRDPHFQLTACSDGRHLVYSTWRNGRFELWASDVDGSNAVRLVPQAVMGFGAGACLPDSNSVVYAADNAVWRVSLSGGTPEKLDLPFAESGYSPDGKLMFYVWHRVEGGAMQEKLVIAPAGSKTPLHTLEYPYGMQFPQFTPDSQALAFLLSRNHAMNIWELLLSGLAPTQLTKFPSGEMFAFEFSREGKQLAFSRGQRKTDVIMMSNFR